MSCRIIDVPVPTDINADPSWQVTAYAELSNAVDTECWKTTDLNTSAAETHTWLLRQERARKFRWLAVPTECADPGPADVIGYGTLVMPLLDNLSSANLFIGVAPQWRRRGVGTALWQRARATIEEHGRSVVQGWSPFTGAPADDDPTAIAPLTGTGRLPAHNPGAQFALAHGFVLHQAERMSRLDLPIDADLVQRLHAQAVAAAGDDYEVVTWHGPVPEEWIESYCQLQTAMSTDAPSGAMTVEAEVWDADRVRHVDRVIAEMGRSELVSAAVHKPSAKLAGYTALESSKTTPESLQQENTIVLRAHRGHRLGMLLKTANLQAMAQLYPQVRRVTTWNAQENDHMLAINVALGFRPAGGSGAWELRLPQA